MSIHPSLPSAGLALSLLLLASGCGRDTRQVRHYQEIVIAPVAQPAMPSANGPMMGTPPMAGPMAGPMSGPPGMAGDVPAGPALHLAWTMPDGWAEGSGPSIRIATLTVDGAECSIVAFPGDTGGLEANLRRWLGQLNVPPPAEDLWGHFLREPATVATQGGWPCSVFDFEGILPASAGRSILAGILVVDGQTVFVKLMGPRPVLAAQKSAFQNLCASLRKKSDV